MDYLDLNTYDYPFDRELIAQKPLSERDASRLMQLSRRDGLIREKVFRELPQLLKAGDILVFNNSRVRRARLFARKSEGGARIEVLVLTPLADGSWEVMLKPAKRVRPGMLLEVDNTAYIRVIERIGDIFKIVFTEHGDPDRTIEQSACEDMINRVGEMPLPPYITSQNIEPERYQTLYARDYGSAAAPTAGLHFTRDLMDRLEQVGIEFLELDLHIGIDTFRPVQEENILEHKMHSEFYRLEQAVAAKLNEARGEGRRLISVGTTAFRALEANIRKYGEFREAAEATEIFIYPGQEIQSIDGLITNFHLPKSTLIMMVACFAGYDHIIRAYAHAVKKRFRFYSLGDAMLIT